MVKKDKANDESSIWKIVYFDQGSATDYIQLFRGGDLLEEETSSDAASTNGSAEVKAGAGIKARLSRILGFHGEVGANATLGASFGSDTIVKSILTNTLLTDFLDVVGENSDDGGVKPFAGYRIEPVENSLASMALLSPYLSMLRGGGIPAGDFNISLDKIDSTINNAKGYFEFVGTKESKGENDGDVNEDCEEVVVFRFNNTSFKNNYKASDLTRMRLKLYAIKVGSTRLSDLDVSSELNVTGAGVGKNPKFPGIANVGEDQEATGDELPMYDVILAGVSVDG